MKKKVKEKVLAFMESVDTCELSTTKFIYEFIYFNLWYSCWHFREIFLDEFLKCNPEWIVRARRKVIADHGIWKRTKADTEEEYIEEFARTNKFLINN